MDVIILLAFTAVFGGWLFWLSQRDEPKRAPPRVAPPVDRS
jgi:hypothetical protein